MDSQDNLMLSQYVAYYLYQDSEPHKKEYLKQLIEIGFSGEEADRMFEFEADILTRFHREYMVSPTYTTAWFFGLSQPFFMHYPKTKEDIMKEHFLTMSELIKIIDEAEWHYWNHHEDEVPKEVWAEIFEWHVKGKGGEFAIQYFQMIAKETGIPEEKIVAYGSHEARYLNMYRW